MLVLRSIEFTVEKSAFFFHQQTEGVRNENDNNEIAEQAYYHTLQERLGVRRLQ